METGPSSSPVGLSAKMASPSESVSLASLFIDAKIKNFATKFWSDFGWLEVGPPTDSESLPMAPTERHPIVGQIWFQLA
jgi:hypothetical protein